MEGWTWVLFGSVFTVWLAVISYDAIRRKYRVVGAVAGIGAVIMAAFTIYLMTIPGFL